MDSGCKTEEAVEAICSKSFFADYTYRSPKYRKVNGHEKEAADIMVVFESYLIVIQVKSRKVSYKEGVISDIDVSRFTASMDKGFRQFRSILEALNRPDFTSFVNGRGFTIEFDKKEIKEVVLILVSAAIAENEAEEPVNVRWLQTCLCLEDSPIPIHLFNLDQFWVLMTLADTISDFLLLLGCRWLFHSKRLISPHTDPIDEWFLFTFEKNRVLKSLKYKRQIDPCGLQRVHAESLKTLEEKERLSYLVDMFIEAISDGIGHEFPIHEDLVRFTKFICPPNSLQASRLLVPLLARLNRAERVQLANAYSVRTKRCISEAREFSFGALVFPKYDEGYLVLGSILPLKQTQVIAFNIGRVFCKKFGKPKAVVVYGCDVFKSEFPVGVILVDGTEGMEEDLGLCEFEQIFSAPIETALE